MTGAVGPITPTLERFESESRTAETVIVARQLFADLDTPVSAYLKIRDASPSFLLESVEGGERIGRYSFIGAAPRHVLRLKDGIQYVDGLSAGACADPLLPLRERAGTFGPPVPSLGRFQGGLLGYLSYEAARYFERLPRAARDPHRLPDAAWMEVDTLLVFDHVAHIIHVLSHAHLDESLTTGYRQAIERIDRLVDRLQQPLEAERWPQASVGSVQSNMTRSRYEEMVRSTKSHIVAGDILQAVISQRLSTQLDGDPFAIYRRLRRT
ncbi:MAG TPA: anthranilate synthase component I, partial [Chloroflexota bacterium]